MGVEFYNLEYLFSPNPSTRKLPPDPQSGNFSEINILRIKIAPTHCFDAVFCASLRILLHNLGLCCITAKKSLSIVSYWEK